MPPLKALYSWTERIDQLQLVIPLKGVSPKKVDIFVSGRLLKINYAPYLLDIVLHDIVDSLRHKATVKDGSLQLTLFKASPGLWGECEVTADKATIKSLKEEAIQASTQLEEQLTAQRSDRRVADEKVTLRKQMTLDEEKRTRLETLQQEEKQEAERQVYETFARMQAVPAAPASVPTPMPVTTVAPPSGSRASTASAPSVPERDEKALFDDDDIDDSDIFADLVTAATPTLTQAPTYVNDLDAHDEEIRYLPPPRAPADGSKVSISFTPRVFPTPMRESKLAEEEDWIAKNRQHLKNHGVLGKNLQRGKGGDVGEEDPAWLKAKGDDFFRAGDSQSALNAYSAAIDMDASLTACYANRSACYLKLGLFAQCRGDCDVVIARAPAPIAGGSGSSDGDPEVARQLASLVKTFCRRGAALCQLGQFAESLADYCQALAKFHQLPPAAQAQHAQALSVAGIEADIARLKVLGEVEMLKKDADKLLAEQALAEAQTKYSQALLLLPVHVPSLANRSAARMALGDLAGAVEDCQAAIDLLTAEASTSGQRVLGALETAHGMLTAVLPPPGSARRRQWLITTLGRQAAALLQLDRTEDAASALQEACALAPTDERLQTDLANVRALLAAPALQDNH